MDRYEYKGYEIFLLRQRWEVFDAEGDLVSEGAGSFDEACAWIEGQERLIIDVLRALKPVFH